MSESLGLPSRTPQLTHIIYIYTYVNIYREREKERERERDAHTHNVELQIFVCTYIYLSIDTYTYICSLMQYAETFATYMQVDHSGQGSLIGRSV